MNQASAEGDEAKEAPRCHRIPRPPSRELWKFKGNASLYVKPQTGALKWSYLTWPIYDVRLGRKLTAEEAAKVDLYPRTSFRWYALPPDEVTKPQLTVEQGVSRLLRGARDHARRAPDGRPHSGAIDG